MDNQNDNKKLWDNDSIGRVYKGMGSGFLDFKIGLSIYEGVGIIECDGRDGKVNYVMNPSE